MGVAEVSSYSAKDSRCGGGRRTKLLHDADCEVGCNGDALLLRIAWLEDSTLRPLESVLPIWSSASLSFTFVIRCWKEGEGEKAGAARMTLFARNPTSLLPTNNGAPSWFHVHAYRQQLHLMRVASSFFSNVASKVGWLLLRYLRQDSRTAGFGRINELS